MYTNVHPVIINLVRNVQKYLTIWKIQKPSLYEEIKIALGYRAEYITRNEDKPSECKTHFYYEKYGKYTNIIDHGKLKVPSDQTCQWLFFFVSSFSIE